MLSAPLRYACLVAMLVCNALFFWDVEARTDVLTAFALGESKPQPASTRVTQTQFRQSNSYTFSNPSNLNRASH